MERVGLDVDRTEFGVPRICASLSSFTSARHSGMSLLGETSLMELPVGERKHHIACSDGVDRRTVVVSPLGLRVLTAPLRASTWAPTGSNSDLPSGTGYLQALYDGGLDSPPSNRRMEVLSRRRNIEPDSLRTSPPGLCRASSGRQVSLVNLAVSSLTLPMASTIPRCLAFPETTT